MMFLSLTVLFTIYVLPVGRRLFALRQMLKLAKAKRLKRVVSHLEVAIAHDTRTLELEQRGRTMPGGSYGPEAQALDGKVDRAVAGLNGYLKNQVQIYGTDHPRGAAAGHVRGELFPDGAQSITSLAYVQEHESVTVLLLRLAAPELAESVAMLPDLGDIAAHLAELNRRYGAALAESSELIPEPHEVRAARAHGQELFLQAVGLIIGEYAGQDDQSDRDALLAPVLDQQQAMRLARRRRRSGTDINPDTGDDLPDDLPDGPDNLPDDVDMAAV